MKKLFALTLLLAFATCAFAAEKTVTFASDTSLNGQKITKGDYKVSYNVNGGTADVQIAQHKKSVASATGRVIESNNTYSRDRVVYRQNDDGSTSLVELQLANQKTAIRFDTQSAALGK